ncbi:MAG: PEP-CTERM system histidine kinase PrsK [Cellvibrionaceae bacterium]
MGTTSVTFSAYLTACILNFALLGVYLYSSRNYERLCRPLTIAFTANGIWLLFWALEAGGFINPNHLAQLIVETLRYLVWMFALLATLSNILGQQLPRNLLQLEIAVAIVAVLVCILATQWPADSLNIAKPSLWQGLVLSISCFICVEQLYRNVRSDRSIKLLCLALTITFFFDVYLMAYTLSFQEFNSNLWQSRAVVAAITSAFLSISYLSLTNQTNNSNSAEMTISRPIVFYTTSLTSVGVILILVGLGGYYLRTFGGEWGNILYSLLLCSALLAVIVTLTSKSARDKLNVLINKHFFRHKYDYRSEWIKLTDYLSEETPDIDSYQRAITAVSQIFKSPGGALWLRRGNIFTPMYQSNLLLTDELPLELINSRFCKIMQQEDWVFSTAPAADSGLGQHNEHLPLWASHIVDLWLIMPLLNGNNLIGFMALSKPKTDNSLTWEDLDLLKSVGRHIASYLERHEQHEKLAESRQMDTFNKLSAFVMHDLKNLIAQQELMVKNAEKHKANPAFVEDAFNTIDNSVRRMSSLVQKLQFNTPEEIQPLNLAKVLNEAGERCKLNKPQAKIHLPKSARPTINADFERLSMVFTHLIRNAQDATPDDGHIDVSLHQQHSNIVVTIEDSGCGMDQEFIRTRLFKPFESTKSSKGMGIGVFQAQEYISHLGGYLDVISELGAGTTFTILFAKLDSASQPIENRDHSQESPHNNHNSENQGDTPTAEAT